MPDFTPTPEQTAIVDAFAAQDGDLVITAGAGSGKTSTLKLLAAATPDRGGLYIAYNKSIAQEASRDFPSAVTCKTSHALAFAAIGREYAHRLNGKRLTGREAALALRINDPLRVSPLRVLAPAQIANIVMRTVVKFCHSADTRISKYHVPHDIAGAEEPDARDALAAIVVPKAQWAWDHDITRTDGKLRFEHDAYLKMWALSGPHIAADFIMLDEAQDTNPCVAGIFDAQTHAQRIAVGDENQAIYGFRGARDHMSTMTARHRLTLSVSFRFGQEIADEANKFLAVLDSDLRITGTGHSEVGSVPAPAAILCRTNAEAVSRLIRAHGEGRKAALVGGGKELKRFAEAADELREKGWTGFPDLAGFESWGAVQDYVEQGDHGSEDFKVAVKLIDTYGTHGVIAAIDRSVDERRADLIVSTAHKAKGREWPSVLIANDFVEPKSRDGVQGVIRREEGMLAYVAVTRARQILDRDGLAWIDHYLDPERTGIVRSAPPAPVSLTSPVSPVPGDGPLEYAVVDENRRALSPWTSDYAEASAALRNYPDAFEVDKRPAAATSAA